MTGPDIQCTKNGPEGWLMLIGLAESFRSEIIISPADRNPIELYGQHRDGWAEMPI